MRYVVDPDQLRVLARGIHDIHDTVAGLGVGRAGGVGDGPGAVPGAALLGSSAVVGALHEVAGNWSQARRRLLMDLTHLTLAVEGAAATYREADGGSDR